MRALSSALTGLVARGLAAASGGHSPSDSAHFRRFETVLEQHYAGRWSVSDYGGVVGDANAPQPRHASARGRHGRPPHP
jgi:hypothetical protein